MLSSDFAATTQAITSIASAILSIVTIWVLFATKNVADKQAKAAQAQTKAAEDAAKMAKDANDLALRQMTSQAIPILVLIRDQAHLAGRADNVAYLIDNQGPGAAQNVRWHYTEHLLAPVDQAISSTLIGARCSAQIAVDQGKLSAPGLTILYHSLDGRSFKTDVKMLNGVLTQYHASCSHQ